MPSQVRRRNRPRVSGRQYARARAQGRRDRYVTPLREGGSLPALVEADDDGLYVLKFRGAGQGRRRWSPRWSPASWPGARAAGSGARARRARPGDRPRRARSGDPGPAARERRGSTSASTSCRRAAVQPRGRARRRTPELAADVVWFDALVTNVDRTPQNPNLLTLAPAALADRPRRGALLPPRARRIRVDHERGRSSRSRDHVLLPYARSIADADARLAPRVTGGAARASRRRDPGRLARRRGSGRCTSTTSPAGSRSRGEFVVEAEGARGIARSRMHVPAGPASRARRADQRRRRPLRCPLKYLAARTALDEERATALWPELDLEEVRAHLARARAGRRGRPVGGPDRAARRAAAIPLARRAVEHDHPALGGAHGPLRRSGA